MLTDIQRAKQSRYFELVDVDNDGYVTASDWAEVGRNLASLRGFQQNSPGSDAIVAVMGTVWTNLSHYCSDPLRGRASLEDWFRFEDERAVNCDDAWYDLYVNTVVRGVFDLLDEDSDGWIGRNELIDLMMSFWVEPRDALLAFERMDTDADGRLGREEFVERVVEFHKSNDPDAPGNWLFGPWCDEVRGR